MDTIKIPPPTSSCNIITSINSTLISTTITSSSSSNSNMCNIRQQPLPATDWLRPMQTPTIVLRRPLPTQRRRDTYTTNNMLLCNMLTDKRPTHRIAALGAKIRNVAKSMAWIVATCGALNAGGRRPVAVLVTEKGPNRRKWQRRRRPHHHHQQI